MKPVAYDTVSSSLEQRESAAADIQCVRCRRARTNAIVETEDSRVREKTGSVWIDGRVSNERLLSSSDGRRSTLVRVVANRNGRYSYVNGNGSKKRKERKRGGKVAISGNFVARTVPLFNGVGFQGVLKGHDRSNYNGLV